MSEREQLSRPEIEARCLAILKRSLGLKHVTYVRIGPYKGSEGWTWRVIEAGPDAGEVALKNAEQEIAKLRGTVDLV